MENVISVKEQDSKYAVGVVEVTKVYRLYEKPIDRLKEPVSISHKDYHQDFCTLNQLSFRIREGETVGIIGTNGSGESTMPRIITGVLTPTTGEVRADGGISTLLELGAGFNVDCIGIESIHMSGTIMDYTKKGMDTRLQDILELAKIEDFVYQSVKICSSGMFIWLAFTLAISVDPEVLIVGKTLSVGNVFFQSKYYHRMGEICQRGTTILMVTHDMGSTIKYCDRVVLLNKGEFITGGPAGRVVNMYKEILAEQLDALEAELERERQQRKSLTGETGQEDAGNGVLTGTGTEETETAGSRAGAGTESGGVEMPDFSGGAGLEGSRLMKDQLTINYDRTGYGDGRAEIVDLGPFDERRNITNLLLKGEVSTIKERIHFNTEIQSPIFTYTIKDKKDTELTGTNTMFEGAKIQPVKRKDEYVVEFTRKMTLQGGEYLLSMNCTDFEQGEHVAYHRLYSAANITVISDRNTVGVHDMESQVEAAKIETGKIEAGNAGPTVNGGL